MQSKNRKQYIADLARLGEAPPVATVTPKEELAHYTALFTEKLTAIRIPVPSRLFAEHERLVDSETTYASLGLPDSFWKSQKERHAITVGEAEKALTLPLPYALAAFASLSSPSEGHPAADDRDPPNRPPHHVALRRKINHLATIVWDGLEDPEHICNKIEPLLYDSKEHINLVTDKHAAHELSMHMLSCAQAAKAELHSLPREWARQPPPQGTPLPHLHEKLMILPYNNTVTAMDKHPMKPDEDRRFQRHLERLKKLGSEAKLHSPATIYEAYEEDIVERITNMRVAVSEDIFHQHVEHMDNLSKEPSDMTAEDYEALKRRHERDGHPTLTLGHALQACDCGHERDAAEVEMLQHDINVAILVLCKRRWDGMDVTRDTAALAGLLFDYDPNVISITANENAAQELAKQIAKDSEKVAGLYKSRQPAPRQR
ncbi:MAG: hypothetical protein V4735_07780 [Pseudomonadota bacterium]